MYTYGLFLILLPLTSGLQISPMDTTGGELQCQCTCTPVGIPGKTIHTSGNMNIINTETKPYMKVSPNGENYKTVVPTVEGSKFPINKTITQYNDVAVSKVRHSLGSTGPGNGHLIKKDNKPQIKWLHSVRSSDAMKPKIQKQPLQKAPIDVTDVASGGLANSGMLMRNKGLSISEVNVNKPEVIEHISTVQVKQKDIIQDPTKTQITKDKDVSTNIKPPGLSNQHYKDIKDQIKPTITDTQKTAIKDQTFSSYSPKANDHVATDIGFVLDGSALSPIISGVMSSGGTGSLGTGYIVENIAAHSQNKAHFVEKNAIVKDGSVPSLVQQPYVKTDASLTKDASTQTTATKTVNNNPQAKVNKTTQTNQQSNSNTAWQNGGNKVQNNNKGSQNNNNKQNPKNNVKKSTRNNKESGWNKNNGQSNQKPNNRNNGQSNQKPNNRNNVQSNQKSNNKPWQNNNKQNGGNRNTWNKQQMKPFQIQTDPKPNIWNSNNNWINNNWGTTPLPTPAMSFGMMDPLLFLGQHHLK